MRVMEKCRNEGRRGTEPEAGRVVVGTLLIWPCGGLAFGVVPHALNLSDPSGVGQIESRSSSGSAD